METQNTYSVQLSGPGLDFKRDLSESNAHELLIWLLKGGKLGSSQTSSIAAIEHHPSTPVGSEHTKSKPATPSYGVLMSVREFADEYEPKRVPDKIASFALYLREHRNTREFKREEIVSLFQESAEPVPKNIGRDLKWTQSIGWIAISHTDRQAFYLTNRGEEAVKNHFSKEVVAKTRLAPATGRRRNGNKAVAPSETPTIEVAEQ